MSEVQKRQISCAPYLVAGLGNPGRRYKNSRHNIGFMAVSRVAQSLDLAFSRMQFNCLLAEGNFQGCKLLLSKPQTFMNQSGRAIAPLAKYYRVPMEQILVVYDDLDLPLGRLRLRPEGGSGGHQGMNSILAELNSQAFPRLRIGIGRPPGRMDPAAYVLRPFSSEEKETLDLLLDRAADCIQAFLNEGLQAAMTQYNMRDDQS